MAGIPGKGGVKGRSGPPGNMNAFKHGLAAIQKRREEGVQCHRSCHPAQSEGQTEQEGFNDSVEWSSAVIS
jgi:hypothetical protein